MRGAWCAIALVAGGCLSVPEGGGGDDADGGVAAPDANLGPVDLAPITAIAAGRRQFCAIGAGGHVACWGDVEFLDVQGQPGGASKPRLVRDAAGVPLSGATDVAVGDESACALVGGAVYCWGYNQTGQLGRGVVDDAATLHPAAPAQIAGASSLTVGASHACALVGDELSCWGRAGDGELGNGDTSRSVAAPILVVDGIASAAAGAHHTCVDSATADDTLCAGLGNTAQNGLAGDVSSFTALNSGRFAVLGASRQHSCGIRDGAAFCWGRDVFGELGDGAIDDVPRAAPGLVSALGDCTAVDVDAEGAISCVVCDEGEVRCWGAGGGGRLGIGSSPATQPTPEPVVALGPAKAVAVGTLTGCALETTGAVRCWGGNGMGELGTGNSADDLPFVESATDAIDFSSVE